MMHTQRRTTFPPSCLRAYVPPCLSPAFTLVELLIVLTLLTLFVGTATFHLDGVTARGRLRSAARQLGAFHALARIEAVSSGQPRRIVFQRNASRCLIQHPELEGRSWRWSDGRSLAFATRVTLDRVIVQGEGRPDQSQDLAIRVASDGTSPTYACILTAGESAMAVVTDGLTGSYRLITDIDPAFLDQNTVFARRPEP